MHSMKTRVLEAMVRGQPNEPLVQSIRDGSETLIQLSADFKSASFKYGKPKIAYFYELEKSFAPEVCDTVFINDYLFLLRFSVLMASGK